MAQSKTELRTKSRDVAFKLIYEREINNQCPIIIGEGTTDEGCVGIATTITGLMEMDMSNLDMDYINTVVDGVFNNLEDIDQAISEHLRGWTLKRLARVDLSIMRLAVFEMKHMPDILMATSIDEAVELSHTYSTDKSGPLINGVLGNIGRELKG